MDPKLMDTTGFFQLITGTGGALVGAVTVIWYLKNEKEKIYISLIDAMNQRIKTLENALVEQKNEYTTLLHHVLKLNDGSPK